MKSSLFDYVRAHSIQEAVGSLASGADAKILAGGQSLVAALNLRLASAELLVDINHIEGLDQIFLTEDMLVIPALVRHAEVGRSQCVERSAPLLAAAMKHVAHPAVRNRGTTCGSLAYADPSAEMPACAVTLNATLVLESLAGRRAVLARDFFLGLYETDRRDDEMLVEVRFPAARDSEVFGFNEIARRHGDFPIVGVAARAEQDAGTDKIVDLDLVIFACETQPHLLESCRAIAQGERWSAALIAELANATAEEIDPMGNLQGSPEAKRRQARVVVERVLAGMMKDACHHV